MTGMASRHSAYERLATRCAPSTESMTTTGTAPRTIPTTPAIPSWDVLLAGFAPVDQYGPYPFDRPESIFYPEALRPAPKQFDECGRCGGTYCYCDADPRALRRFVRRIKEWHCVARDGTCVSCQCRIALCSYATLLDYIYTEELPDHPDQPEAAAG